MATNSDQITSTSHSSVRSDSQITLQPTITAYNSSHDHEELQQSEHPVFQSVMPPGSSRLDSGFGSLHQPNSLNYEANSGSLQGLLHQS